MPKDRRKKRGVTDKMVVDFCDRLLVALPDGGLSPVAALLNQIVCDELSPDADALFEAVREALT